MLCGAAVLCVPLHYRCAALLYLVPSCIIIPSAVAAVRGEFGELYKYTEEEEEKEKSEDKSAEEKKAE